MNRPLISIITVCYNAAPVIGVTLQSVCGQSWPELEYIIVDGASTDATMEIVRKYEKHIRRIVSEKDQGIYDAMNKGLQLATGEFVLFMNAGDVFHSPDTIEKAFAVPGDYDLRYGETLFVNAAGEPLGTMSVIRHRKLPRQLSWRSMRFGMVVGHQSVFVRRRIAPLFDLAHPSSGDIDWLIRTLKNTRPGRTFNTGLIISDFRLDGFSQQQRSLSHKDRYRVLKKHHGLLPNLLNHAFIFLKAAWFRIFA